MPAIVESVEDAYGGEETGVLVEDMEADAEGGTTELALSEDMGAEAEGTLPVTVMNVEEEDIDAVAEMDELSALKVSDVEEELYVQLVPATLELGTIKFGLSELEALELVVL